MNIKGIWLILLSIDICYSQQMGDRDFETQIKDPAFGRGKGPRVMVDESHNNFHKLNGRYAAFGEVLKNDGYRLASNKEIITDGGLQGVSIYVIANALAAENMEQWQLPTPSAFTDIEIETLVGWVSAGGALLLIADHMPFPGAAAALAERFGIIMTNGFAMPKDHQGPLSFSMSEGSLVSHPIINGRNREESIEEVFSFTGQAFKAKPGVPVDPLMIFKTDINNLLPVKAWEFSDQTASFNAIGMWQGAVRMYGRGRVAVFGEAAMFSAQVQGEQRYKMGMNHPQAGENKQFLLNVMHWLSGLLDQ